MSYLEQLTLAEKSELDHALIQERDSAAIEGFQLDEQVFREAWAKIVVNHRLRKAKLQREKESVGHSEYPVAIAATKLSDISKAGSKISAPEQEPGKRWKPAIAKEAHGVG